MKVYAFVTISRIQVACRSYFGIFKLTAHEFLVIAVSVAYCNPRCKNHVLSLICSFIVVTAFYMYINSFSFTNIFVLIALL